MLLLMSYSGDSRSLSNIWIIFCSIFSIFSENMSLRSCVFDLSFDIGTSVFMAAFSVLRLPMAVILFNLYVCCL